ncbi:hypothetical protein SAMN02745687_01110 [Lachnospiraceae bacterium NK3A20]|nr:hypothetical protein SAMN02745687_01110 [Lachnospiraceae bacterium NK3A20]
MAEYRNDKLQLPNVTLCAMTSVDVQATVEAMKYSMRGIDFGDAVIITHRKPFGLPERIRYDHTSKLNNIDDFNYKMVYELGSHIHTDYAMIVHADGFIVHPELWRDEFLDYDYIGAPWPLPKEGDTTTYRDRHGNICRVGNSVGIRSKKLMDFPRENNIPWTGEYAFGRMWFHEDGFLCCKIRDEIEAAGMRIAPLELARYFSHEHMIPEIEGITPFAFHKWEGTNAGYPDFRKPSLMQKYKAAARKLLRRS